MYNVFFNWLSIKLYPMRKFNWKNSFEKFLVGYIHVKVKVNFLYKVQDKVALVLIANFVQSLISLLKYE
jgi:hypothetical protein